MTRFKLNARGFGGLGLLLIILILVVPIWAGLLETGIIGELPTNIVQVEEGVRHTFPNSPATVPLLIFMVLSFIALVFLLREKKKRSRK